jgi:hypothetical protein
MATTTQASPADSPKGPGVTEELVKKSLSTYLGWGRFWRTLQYVLGIAAVLIAGLPAAREIWKEDASMQALGLWGAFLNPVMVALLSFLGAQRNANWWLAAWRILQPAWARYCAGKISPEELLEAWKQAEGLSIKDIP